MYSTLMIVMAVATSSFTSASPVKRADPVSQLLSIAPSSSTCDGAEFPSECAVSDAATVHALVASFAKYGVRTAPEQAALLSWMAYESGEFQYNRNHFPAPGRPGQGTRTMMMPNFIGEYAASIPELADGVAAAGDDVDKVLELVLPDEYSFASAAWYYSTHCLDEVKEGVKSGGEQGWEAFLTECVDTTVGEDGEKSRRDYWQRASRALGIPV